MTKKDYIKLAAALNETLDYAKHGVREPLRDQAIMTVGYAAECIARTLKADNGRFDRDRFLTACGVTP